MADIGDIVDKQLSVQSTDQANIEFDRLMLRIYQDTSLMSYLNDINQEGSVVELDFLELPDAAIETVVNLIGPVKVEVVQFVKDLKRHTGFKFDIQPLADIYSAFNDQPAPAKLSSTNSV